MRVIDRRTFLQLVRFGLVGVANTAAYYLGYRLLLLLMPYLAAHLLAYALSVVFSFYLNCWFTYGVRPTWRRFVLFPLSVVVNFLFTTFGTVILVEWLGFPEEWAPLLAGIMAIPFTFLTARYVLTGSHHPDRLLDAAMEEEKSSGSR